MQSLKKIVYTNLRRITIAMMVFILLIAIALQILAVQKQARENASATFVQIEQIINESEDELAKLEKAYAETCLLNAESIAYVIEKNPDILGDVEQFRSLAEKLEVDEIHIFTSDGRIFTGTHPEYYNFTFDSGQQMNFFKPMLEDHSLRLCQEITPNTAEGKLVQYSALWSDDDNYIIQVGMYPDAVLEATQKSELSYVFSLLQGNPGVTLFAVDAASGEVIGSTYTEDNGKHISELGFQQGDFAHCLKGGHVDFKDINSFCITKDLDGTLLGYAISGDKLYDGIFFYTLLMVAGLTLIAVMLIFVILRFTENYIISDISRTNIKLRAVTEGNLDERADAGGSLEFHELNSHINDMIRSLLASTDKMSFVLNRTNIHIGVYEYNTKMRTVRLTEHIPGIFGLSPEETALLSSDYHQMQSFIDTIRRDPVTDLENTYRFTGKGETFIKLEEFVTGGDVLGIVMDVTEETLNLKRLEAELDIDLLTGLYNRRGMNRQLEQLFSEAEPPSRGAVIIIDSDDLKAVNDAYGHSVGDSYLQKIAGLIRRFGSAKRLAARMGGDEFMLLVYGYNDDVSIHEDLSQIRSLQGGIFLGLADGTKLPVHFSLGYVMINGRRDYKELISEADNYMYSSKRLKKQSSDKEIN